MGEGKRRHALRMNKSGEPVNPALARLQASVRIGGKGSVRRKKKVVHKTTTTDDSGCRTRSSVWGLTRFRLLRRSIYLWNRARLFTSLTRKCKLRSPLTLT